MHSSAGAAGAPRREGNLGNYGCGCGLLAVLLAMVTAIPFLGWANWFVTLPAAVIAILLSLVGLVRGEQRGTAVIGLVLGVVILFWALFRLAIGHGIV